MKRAFVSLLVLLVTFQAAGDPDAQEDFDKMIREYSVTISSNPEQAEMYLKRGNAYFPTRKFDQAVDGFSAAIELDDGLDQAYYSRGLALGRSGFIQDLSVFIERNPDNSMAYAKRGVRYLGGNRSAQGLMPAQSGLLRVSIRAQSAHAG